MSGKIPVKTLGKKELSHVGLAIKIKKMLNDIIDAAFQESVSAGVLAKFKRFTIFASETELDSKLGDCWYNKDGSASIRLLGLSRDRYQDSIILAIHEISHHVDRSLNGSSSGHGPEFYRIHKILLYASFDMGILTIDDVLHSELNARNKNKLAKMMTDYVPRPIDYKSDIAHVFVYNAYAIKDELKARGYSWNGLEFAWTIEVSQDNLDAEKNYLLSLGLSESDIKCVEGAAVVTRLRKSAKLFNVPYESNDLVKKFGYRWTDAGKKKYWKKKIDGDTLSAEEQKELEKIPGIRIVID